MAEQRSCSSAARGESGMSLEVRWDADTEPKQVDLLAGVTTSLTIHASLIAMSRYLFLSCINALHTPNKGCSRDLDVRVQVGRQLSCIFAQLQ